MYDPNPKIYREGWRMLRDAGIYLADFSPDLRAELVADNADFIGQFHRAVGQQGEAFSDYRQNGGHFNISGGRCSDFETRWTPCSETAIYALDYAHNVALARYAKEFDEIDDPGALDFGNYTAPVGIGQIVVFRNDDGFALVKVLEMMVEPGGQTGVGIAFELRTPVREE
jgi:diaminohydroxyphosphoribosylaminopyrimidine deaminase/5-amino-6-(5-phosphoribosylamino)uracil reductase